MANIIIRNKDGGTVAPRAEFEPARVMRDWLRWDPFREMMAGLPTLPEIEPVAFTPAFEIKETKESYIFKADLPGIEEKDLDITRTGNRLTVSGKREAEKEEKDEKYYAYERSYGTFMRSFTLPEGVDVEHVQAEMKSGVLTLVVPKTPEAQPKKISLKNIFTKNS